MLTHSVLQLFFKGYTSRQSEFFYWICRKCVERVLRTFVMVFFSRLGQSWLGNFIGILYTKVCIAVVALHSFYLFHHMCSPFYVDNWDWWWYVIKLLLIFMYYIPVFNSLLLEYVLCLYTIYWNIWMQFCNFAHCFLWFPYSCSPIRSQFKLTSD